MDNVGISKKKTPGIKRGRPNEIKLPLGLRIYPSDRDIIEKKHRCKIQEFFDRILSEEIMRIKGETSLEKSL
jgi:hypothetical protein